MMIWHETTPRLALKILRSGEFWGNRMDSENGMNAYPLAPGAKQYYPGQAHQKGAKMIFEWSGPLVTVTAYTPAPLSDGALFDEAPHRLFLRYGESKTAAGQNSELKLIDIQLTGAGKWEDTIDPPDFPGLTLKTQKWRNYLASKKEGWAASEISKIVSTVEALKSNPKLIKVVNAYTRPHHPH